MPRTIVFLYLLIASNSIAQTRWGFETYSSLIQLSHTLHIQKIVAPHFLFGAGVGFVGKHSGSDYNDKNNSSSFQSHPSNVQFDSIQGFHSSEIVRTRGVQAQLMSWYFFESDKRIHGFRINFNTRFGIQHYQSKVVYEKTNGEFEQQKESGNFKTLTFSFELYHTIRLTERNTFYYGTRAPFHVFLGKSYRPTEKSEVYNRFIPEIAIGFTREIRNKKGQ